MQPYSITLPERILPIDPARHGLGCAVLETSPLRLLDWTTRRCRKDDGSALVVVKYLILKYRPTRVVLPDWRDAVPPHRKRALEQFIEAIGPALTSETLPIETCSQARVRAFFADQGAHTKQEIAEYLGRQFPELRSSIPRKRRIWERERPAQSVFDAVAMALAVMSPGHAVAR